MERKPQATITSELRSWLRTLAPERANRVTAAMDRVSVGGPTQGRPLVDHIKGSRVHKLKELRTGTMRVFFVFERDRAPHAVWRRRQARGRKGLVPAHDRPG